MKYSLLFILVFLVACGKSEPIQFTKSQNQYIGVWQYLHEAKTDNTLDIKKILLVVNPDSSAIYRQCIISRYEYVRENSSSKRSSSHIVSLPHANVIGLANNEISLEQETPILSIGKIFVSYDLEITKAPYLENDRWYMGIEGTVLKKLIDSEIGNQTKWECPETDDS